MNGSVNNTPLFGKRSGRRGRDSLEDLQHPLPEKFLAVTAADGIMSQCAVLEQLSEAGVPGTDVIQRVGLGSPLEFLRLCLVKAEALKDPRLTAHAHERGAMPPSFRDQGRFARMVDMVLGKVVESAVGRVLDGVAKGNNLMQVPPIPRHVFNRIPDGGTFVHFDPWEGVVREPVALGSEQDSADGDLSLSA
jgi:hypothetical protein